MKLGTENKKKVAFLAVLALVAGYLVYTNVLSGPAGHPGPGGRSTGARTRAGGPGGHPAGSRGRPRARHRPDGGSGPKGHPAGFQPERL